jgi:hypothetical protein
MFLYILSGCVKRRDLYYTHLNIVSDSKPADDAEFAILLWRKPSDRFGATF